MRVVRSPSNFSDTAQERTQPAAENHPILKYLVGAPTCSKHQTVENDRRTRIQIPVSSQSIIDRRPPATPIRSNFRGIRKLSPGCRGPAYATVDAEPLHSSTRRIHWRDRVRAIEWRRMYNDGWAKLPPDGAIYPRTNGCARYVRALRRPRRGR
jgi:hypothetical protein